MAELIDKTIETFASLPGLGRKSATRIVNFLLKDNTGLPERLAATVRTLKLNIRSCKRCGAWCEKDECEICADVTRERSVICVVSEASDVATFVKAGGFNGLFHVLGGLISPLDGISPENLNIKSLLERVITENISEVILATNSTFEGDATAVYIMQSLKEKTEGKKLKITRLATGIPVGSDLEYTDKLTILRSMQGRKEM